MAWTDQVPPTVCWRHMKAFPRCGWMREVEYWPLGIPQPDISLGTWSLPCACLPRTWPGVGLQAVSKPQTTKAIVNSSAERHNKGLKKQVSVPFCNWIMHPSWRREWQPTPVFLPGESRGQRSLARYSPWGCKESDTTAWLTHTMHPYSEDKVFFLIICMWLNFFKRVWKVVSFHIYKGCIPFSKSMKGCILLSLLRGKNGY